MPSFPLIENKALIVLSPIGLMLEGFKFRMFGFVCMRPWLLEKGLESRFDWVVSS